MVLSAGGLGATLTVYLTIECHMNALLASILVTSFISALTVGGKAYFKTIATKKSDKIVLAVGKIMQVFTKLK